MNQRVSRRTVVTASGPPARLLTLALAAAPIVAAGCERPDASRDAAGASAVVLDTARRSADEFVGWGFAVATGPELAVRPRAPGPDFTVYDVVRRADSAAADAPVLLSVYAGDYPQFTAAGLPPSRVAGLPARDRRAVDGAGRVSRDVLLELPGGTEAPSSLHAWYRALAPAQAARADSVLAHLRPTVVGR